MHRKPLTWQKPKSFCISYRLLVVLNKIVANCKGVLRRELNSGSVDLAYCERHGRRNLPQVHPHSSCTGSTCPWMSFQSRSSEDRLPARAELGSCGWSMVCGTFTTADVMYLNLCLVFDKSTSVVKWTQLWYSYRWMNIQKTDWWWVFKVICFK